MIPESRTRRKHGVAFTLAQARKCLYPYPVYEAHFADNTVGRLSFWSPRNKPIDFDAGRAISEIIFGKAAINGFVERDVPGQPWLRVRDPRFSGEVIETVKRPASKARLQRMALVAACEEAVAVMCQVGLPYSVQMAGEKARKALNLAA